MAGAGPARPPARAVRGWAGTGREGASRTVCQPRSPMLLPGLRKPPVGALWGKAERLGPLDT